VTAARLLIGSGNAGKVAELRAILAGLPVTLLALDELPTQPDEPDEDLPTFAENAAAKAAGYARATGMPAIADDSGLEVAAMRGAPGVRSKRYFGDDLADAERNARLLAVLDGVRDRAARFVSVIALAFPDGRVETFEGTVDGSIADSPRGAGGHGYDPVFVVAGTGRTMAELAPGEKNEVSHRGRAGRLLRARLTRGL